VSTVVIRPLANEVSINSASTNAAGMIGNPQSAQVAITVATYGNSISTSNYASFTVLANSEVYVFKGTTDNIIVSSAANVQVVPVAYRSM
jgi:hypothetical protein